MSSSDPILIDPAGRYVVQRPSEAEPALKLWMVERLRFHTSQPPWQKELVRRLVDELRVLPLNQAEVLCGVFVSDDPARVDAENVLFYNLDARSFAHAPQCVRFERSWAAAPAPPTALSVPARYYHRYEPVAAAEGFRSWRMTDDPLAEWTDVPCTKIAGERAGWHIWHGMRAAASAVETARAATPAQDFGLTATARVPANVHATAIGAVKGVVDGAIASFQRFPDNARAHEVADVLASVLPGTDARTLLEQLTDPHDAVFREPPFNANGRLALNPCDDRCVAGELSVVVDPSLKCPLLSGRLAHVKPTPESGPNTAQSRQPELL